MINHLWIHASTEVVFHDLLRLDNNNPFPFFFSIGPGTSISQISNRHIQLQGPTLWGRRWRFFFQTVQTPNAKRLLTNVKEFLEKVHLYQRSNINCKIWQVFHELGPNFLCCFFCSYPSSPPPDLLNVPLPGYSCNATLLCCLQFAIHLWWIAGANSASAFIMEI